LSNASIELKIKFFYEITITVFQFTQHAIENRSACQDWHACHRLPTPDLSQLSECKLWLEDGCSQPKHVANTLLNTKFVASDRFISILTWI
jgi:hypothetical protein